MVPLTDKSCLSTTYLLMASPPSSVGTFQLRTQESWKTCSISISRGALGTSAVNEHGQFNRYTVNMQSSTLNIDKYFLLGVSLSIGQFNDVFAAHRVHRLLESHDDLIFFDDNVDIFGGQRLVVFDQFRLNWRLAFAFDYTIQVFFIKTKVLLLKIQN